ncbi:MAG: BrnT family toxin [Candidatus Rokubacteria bacterium]|nr:BrnT family toxin [Candidatus Rokubacteria bacterium]
MRFLWNDAKAQRNLRSHGVEFSEARTTFFDPLGRKLRDEDHSHAEERIIRIGRSDRGRLLVTVFTEGGDHIRIISSRRATRREVKSHEEGI